MKKNTVIFTDLDGSLLNHFDYSFDAAIETLKQLEQARIPIVCATSKTFQELLVIRKALNNPHPMVVENGAAIYIPEHYFPQTVLEDTQASHPIDGYYRIAFSWERAHWLEQLEKVVDIPKDSWQSFHAMGINGIIEKTGLPKEKAELANQREFSEPVVWQGDEQQKAAFIKQLNALGANVLEGGRFLHITDHTDKGKALNVLSKLYERLYKNKIHSIALGDGYNDLPMLYAANQGVLIRSQANPLPNIESDTNIYITKLSGPEGWVEAVQTLALKHST